MPENMTRPILLTSSSLWFEVVADVDERHLRVVAAVVHLRFERNEDNISCGTAT